MITKDLGAVTAYAYAVEGGYTGTEEEFTQLMADLGITVDEFEHFSVSVSTLPAGSSATASYSDGVLSLGIPKGDKGDTGNTGATGATPNLSIGTVETTAEPSVTITGTVDNPVLNFGLVKGDKGETGEVSEAELTQAFEDFSANGTVANAEQLTTDIRANDQTPYLFRTAGGSVDIGDREYINGIVGGTVAFNQLLNDTYEGDGASILSITKSGDVVNAEIVSTFEAGWQIGIHTTKTINCITNHKYLIAVDAYLPHNGLLIVRSPQMLNGNEYSSTIQANTWTSVAMIKNGYSTATGARPYLYPNNSADYSVGDVMKYRNFMIFDLTQLFGSTIADYIYSLEQANAGAGVAFFKSLFPKPYYAYNAGELMSVRGLVSHDMVGFNAWDEEWESGSINADTGQNESATAVIRSKGYIPTIPNATYFFHIGSTYGTNVKGRFYDADKNYLGVGAFYKDQSFTIPSDAHFIRFALQAVYGDTYKNDICINLSWDGSRDGEYEPYQKWSYPLDSDLELRGIPKISNGNLYYDGDVYLSDGTVNRKYGIVDLGTLTWTKNESRFYVPISVNDATAPYPNNNVQIANALCAKYPTVNRDSLTITDKTLSVHTAGVLAYININDSAYENTAEADFKTAMSGVYLVYELATPTTETADPYTSPQIVSDFGTEEYVIDDDVFAIPVGHNTDYPVDLKAKLEMAPNSPSQGNGDYIVRQTNGTNEYVPLVIEEVLPQTPSSNGTYSLTLTVANGEATLSWT